MVTQALSIHSDRREVPPLLGGPTPFIAIPLPLPKGETIMNRSIEVTGGLKAFAAKKSQVVKGTVELPMGLKGSLTLTKAEPNLQLSEMEMPNMGKILDGFDGTHAWAYNAMQGPSLKQGDEKAFAERGARFHTEDWKKEYKTLETVATETVEGESCYKVICTPLQGDPSTQFFSVKSGLLIKTLMKAKTAMGEIPVESTLKDYKKAGDVLLPHTLVQSFSGQTMTMTFTSVEWNVPLPKDKFTLPAEVLALVKK